MGFMMNTKGRAFVATVHIENMKKAGLTEEQYKQPDYLAEVFTNIWVNSGKGRKCGIVVCVSKDGLYHAHMALYSNNSTTLKNVSNILFNSHTEPQLSGKKELLAYLQKTNQHKDKGEQILYSLGLENIEDKKGSRSDLEQIGALLDAHLKPNEIMQENFAYRKYSKLIKEEYLARRIKETPLIKDMSTEWHMGDSGSGKTHEYIKLCEAFSPEDIYFCNDFENGGFDMYLENGAPRILFLEELKGNSLKFSVLLSILGEYSRAQSHSRYLNTYNHWDTVIITSVYAPDEIYNFMVDESNRHTDSFEQLIRRITKVVYHYKDGDEYKTVSVSGAEYKNKLQLLELASIELLSKKETSAGATG